MFIQLKRARLVGSRFYAAHSVVEVDASIRKRLVEQGEAVDHSGPACEPSPDPERKLKPETAELRRRVEQATSR